MIRFISRAILATLLFSQAAGAVTFSVSFTDKTRSEAASGRLLVYLLKPEAAADSKRPPADTSFDEEDPQPIFGIDVKDLSPGQVAIVDDSATAFPVKLSELPSGSYRAQAVLDLHHDNSSWQREPGNLYSAPIKVEIKAGDPSAVNIELSRVVKENTPTKVKGVEIVSVRSKLLSDFRGHDVFLRAGIAFPTDYDANRSYAAIFEVPGFGGDHMGAYFRAMRRGQRDPASPREVLARNAFYIELDPESPNGHTLFCDSDVNGPCGKALITELIPELEKKFKLIAQPSARIVTGHSSGGWSSLWLGTEYADFFGACWSGAPDPVDFRRLEKCDIYNTKNLYTDYAGKEIPSARFGGKETMTTRQENGMENVLGPRNESGQQWDSWQACWGHRDATGWPKPLYDPITGAFDHTEAESYRRFDIADRLRKDPKHFVPIFRNQVHVVCGTEDTYYLNEAVELLKHDLEELDPQSAAHEGYIALAPGDHGSVTQSKEYRAWSEEMVSFLKKNGHIPAQPTTKP